MVYEILRGPPDQLTFVTADSARRGRGILFALAPVVLLSLAWTLLFALADSPLAIWQLLRRVFGPAVLATAGLSLLAFWVGRRVQDRVEATPTGVRIVRVRALGARQVTSIARESLSSLAIRPNVRSLGADILLVAHLRDGTSIAIAEGEPHGGQMQAIARQLCALMDLPLKPSSIQAK
jgi:hypothetical protein